MAINYLQKSAENVGLPAIQAATGVDSRAVRRWISRGKLPRTDYTGETDYALRISQIPDVGVTFSQLLPIPKELKDRICSSSCGVSQ